MSILKIPWGRHEEYGIVSPSDKRLVQGLQCGVVCVECNRQLIRAGVVLPKHFRHFSLVKNENHCAESAIHAHVKSLLAQAIGYTIRLPNYTLSIPIKGSNNKLIDIEFLSDFIVTKSDMEITQTIHNGRKRRPDVILQNLAGQKLAIEVHVENAKQPDYVEDMNNVGIPVIEIEVYRELEYSVDRLVDLISRLNWLVKPKEALQNANQAPISMGIAGTRGSGDRGGWAVVFADHQFTRPFVKLSDGKNKEDTSSGRIEKYQMFIAAAIMGLRRIPPHLALNIYTDDKNIRRIISDALEGKGKGNANAEFIKSLKATLVERKAIKVVHVDEWAIGKSSQYAIVAEAKVLAKTEAEKINVVCSVCKTRRHPPSLSECKQCSNARLRSLSVSRR